MKKNLTAVLLSLCIMVGLPWLAVTFGKGDDAMAICLLLFFAVDPICSVFTGVYAGKNVSQRWFQPILTALFFLAGVWTFFDSSEPAFLLYAGCYGILGLLAMAVTALLYRTNK